MSNIVTASKAKQFVHLEGQKDGTSYNINNIVYYLPRTINQLTKLVGNDVVLRGMNIDSAVSTINNSATVTVDPGVLICDSTLIETTETSTLDLNNIDTYTSGGCIVLYVQYQYLQTVAVNAVKFGLTFVTKNGKCVDNWDHNKNRLVLEFWTLDTSTKTMKISEEPYILIENKEYYRCGYNLNSLTLSKYVLYMINAVGGGSSGSGGSGLVSALADKAVAEGDLQVLDDLNVGGYLAVHGDGSQFDGTVTFNQDIHIKDDLQVYGERTLIDSPDVQFGSQTLILDRNEMGSGTKDRFSGINVRRGLLPNAVLYFDENTDKWVIGTDNDYQTIVRSDDLNNLTHSNIKDWLSQFTIDFNTLFTTKTTDSLPEGNSHLYFNETRVYDVLLRKLRAGRGITLSQQDNQILITNTMDWTVASATTIGGIKVGAHLSITSDGLLSADQQTQENFTTTLKNKLENLTGYTHPDTHPATIIVQDSTHRFVTDEQIANWDIAAGYQLPTATSDVLGGVKTGDNITNIDGKISVKPATKETYGVIKIGNNLTIDTDGKISAQNSYVHPTFVVNNSVLTGNKVLSNINITNEGHVTSVQSRELTLNDLGYTTGSTYPEIKSFTVTPNVALLGSTINSVKLEWATNKLIKSQKLDGITVLDPSLRTYTHSIALHSARTYTLIIDDLTTISAKTTVYFKNNRYWGVSPIPTIIDRAFLESLGNTELEDSKSITFTTTSHTNEYIWYAYPARAGKCVFYAGPTQGGFDEPQLVSITNISGYTEQYYVYKSEYSNLSEVTVSTDPTQTKISIVNNTGGTNTGTYTLPVASSNILGGVKIGDNLSITADGVLSASPVDSVYPEIKSLSISPDIALMGSTVPNVLLTWETNKDIIKQTFNNNIGELNAVLRQYKHTDSITQDRIYTLTIQDNKTIEDSVSIKFKNKRYWGVAEEPSSITTQFITSLSSNEIEDDKDITFVVDAKEDQFIWYAYPKRSGTAEFFVGMAEGGFTDPIELNITNEVNYTELYYIYRSIQPTLGQVIVSTDPTAVDSMGNFYMGGSGISTPATHTELGVIKVGENLEITSDGLLSAVDKVYPKIESFTASPSVALLGSTVSQVILEWETNKRVNNQHLSDIGSLDPNERTHTIETTLTSSYTYTLTLDDVSQVSSEATVYFKNKRYWGTSINPDMVNGEFIKSLQNSQLEDKHDICFTVNVNPNELIWYAYPKRSGTTDFFVGMAKGGFIDDPLVINITNESNYMEEYYVYKSNQAYLGNITVTTDVGLLAITDGGAIDIPIATETVLGGVQIGDGLKVTTNGTISTYKQGFIKSFSVEPSLCLMGSTISEITFNWNVFGTYKTLSIDSIDAIISSPFVYNTSINTNVDYELQLEDDFHIETMKTSIVFSNYCMYGSAEIPDQVNDNFLNSLNKKLSETPEFVFTTVTNEDEYIWFACPARFNIRFQTPSGNGGFEDPITIDHTNSSGFTESYNIYRSVQSNLDFCEIEVRI